MSTRTTVLVVDDSAFMRKMVTEILSQAPDLEVVGHARDGVDALEKIEAMRPDVVTLDVEMPRMGGVEALTEITRRWKTPVVMLSSLTAAGATTTIRCLEAGAVDFVLKPSGAISLDIAVISEELIQKVRTASRVQANLLRPHATPCVAEPAMPIAGRARRCSLLVIGSSTGGPRALQSLIPALPANLRVPVVIVQHMPPSFTRSLADRLNELSQLTVQEAQEGDVLTPGVALVAPGGYHLEFDPLGRAHLSDAPPIHAVKPSIDATLASVVRTHGQRMVAVLLTGMGRDGAAGLKAVKAVGGQTLVEDESTCVVFGMPRAAIELGAADRVVPLDRMARAITEAVIGSNSQRASA